MQNRRDLGSLNIRAVTFFGFIELHDYNQGELSVWSTWEMNSLNGK